MTTQRGTPEPKVCRPTVTVTSGVSRATEPGVVTNHAQRYYKVTRAALAPCTN